MNEIEFSDCEFRYVNDDGDLNCSNKEGYDQECDNCEGNIHLNCTNYNPKKDMCLKWFEKNISSLKDCKEKTTFSDKELSRKWSN